MSSWTEFANFFTLDVKPTSVEVTLSSDEDSCDKSDSETIVPHLMSVPSETWTISPKSPVEFVSSMHYPTHPDENATKGRKDELKHHSISTRISHCNEFHQMQFSTVASSPTPESIMTDSTQSDDSMEYSPESSPCQWKSAVDPNTNKTYYFDLKTGKTQWEKVSHFSAYASTHRSYGKSDKNGVLLTGFGYVIVMP